MQGKAKKTKKRRGKSKKNLKRKIKRKKEIENHHNIRKVANRN